MDILRNFFEDTLSWISFPSIQFFELIEILALAFIAYQLIKWCRNTRAWMLFKGLAVILLLYVLAVIFQMNVILWIFSKTISVGITLLIIVFQPELRRALEQLGQKKIISAINIFDDQKEKNERFSERTVAQIISATFDLAREKTGALIVIERDVMLVEYVSTGITLDADISSQLLINIFEHNTPLHDGAVIVRGNKIVSATCYLPLSDNIHLSKELGTRHRAGIGVSEVSDSLTVIVSEETGKVSIASGGRVTRNVSKETLKNKLEEIQLKTAEPMKMKSFKDKGLKKIKNINSMKGNKNLKGRHKNEKINNR